VCSSDLISRQISFTHEYQDIGVTAPTWQNIQKNFLNAAASLNTKSIMIEPCQENITIYADPLLEKVFYNLIDNSLRYGEKLTRIRITHHEDEDGLTLVYEDDGIGIPMEEKQKIFHKGFGKNTGLGLFLAREILAITRITITENGEPGKGVRFGILVPKDMYRMIGATKPLS
jgi:signal transduction histidine kinase